MLQPATTENVLRVKIPYRPRPLWATEIHPALDRYRFSLIVAHRRFGKTVGIVNHTVRKASLNRLEAPQYAYVAPLLKQAKMIAWNYLKKYTAAIPGRRKPNESDLYVELPPDPRYEEMGLPGARIHIVGADNPDVLRGTYWDGVVLDEWALMKPWIWSEVLLAALEDRQGWAVKMGTPKGQNHFYEDLEYAQANPAWWTGIYRADETGVFSQEQIDFLRKESRSDRVFRQEYLCDFTASADNVLITIDLVFDAINRPLRLEDVFGQPRILGIDPARFGDDEAVVCKRQGLITFPFEVYTGLDNMQLAGRIAKTIDDWKPDAVFCDAGQGSGVIDRLRQLGYDVIEVHFGGHATNAKAYVNKRAEIWDLGREHLEAGGKIPNDPLFKGDLVAPTFTLDADNKLKLEPKESIKERLGRSTDRGDAWAVTFAFPVTTRNRVLQDHGVVIGEGGGAFAQTQYNPLQRRG